VSKLLGIVNPAADPSDQFNYWLWRATEIPWDYEQLNVEQMPVEAGNVQFRVIGPHTPRYPDGVFLKLQINSELHPQIMVSTQGGEAPPAQAIAISTEIAPVIPQLDAPVKELNVATTERLEGETKAQAVRRKAIALRWQAAKLEKLAEDMEVLEAQGLI
jgi:hypothetical protein